MTTKFQPAQAKTKRRGSEEHAEATRLVGEVLRGHSVEAAEELWLLVGMVEGTSSNLRSKILMWWVEQTAKLEPLEDTKEANPLDAATPEDQLAAMRNAVHILEQRIAARAEGNGKGATH